MKPDPRLDRVKAADWNIKFLTDEELRNVLTAYFVWDHPLWGAFDTDDFCDALAGKPSELSSKLLVYAVVAWATVSSALASCVCAC